ncbi:MAG: redoxin domain-containing protein [Planctomycetes bacterium]|nr:redoxin domain-containing protein [Planctomycetota bacterium]
MVRKTAALSLLALLSAGPLLAQAKLDDAPGSNVLGQQCPELQLAEEPVQGAKITQADFAGKMVFFMFYQRGCEGCEEQAMPALQKLFEKYEYSKCALVFAINTAFDKDKDEYLADTAATAAHLRAKGWTMPVMRDLDEASNPLFTIDKVSGTPQAVVLDENGFVCDHDWYSAKDEIRDLHATADAVFAGLNCECVRLPRKMTGACKGAYESIRKGEYTDAWASAADIAEKPQAAAQDKRDAEELKEWLTGLVRNRTRKFEEHFDYDPIDTVDRAQAMAPRFKAIPGAQELEVKIDSWRNSDSYSKFKQVKDELEVAESEIAKPTADQAAWLKKLQDIGARAGNTSVGDRARSRAGQISSPQAEPVKAAGGTKAATGGSSRAGGQTPPVATGGRRMGGTSDATKPAVAPSRSATRISGGAATAPRTRSESRVLGSSR